MSRRSAAGARAHGGGNIVQVVPLRPVACHVVVRVLPLAHPAVGEPAVVLIGDRRRRQHAGRRPRRARGRARGRARPRGRRSCRRGGGVRGAARRDGRRPPRPARACRAGCRRRRRCGAARAARGGEPPPGGGAARERRRAQPQRRLARRAPRQAQAAAAPRRRRRSRGDLPRHRLPETCCGCCALQAEQRFRLRDTTPRGHGSSPAGRVDSIPPAVHGQARALASTRSTASLPHSLCTASMAWRAGAAGAPAPGSGAPGACTAAQPGSPARTWQPATGDASAAAGVSSSSDNLGSARSHSGDQSRHGQRAPALGADEKVPCLKSPAAVEQLAGAPGGVTTSMSATK